MSGVPMSGDDPMRPEEAPAGLTIFLLRHADAGDSSAWTGDDAERPLSKKGRRQARRLGDLLAAADARPDAILTSPLVRAAETARLVAKRVGVTATASDALAPGLTAAGLRTVVAGLEPGVSCVMLVGHDPDFSALVSSLTGSRIRMAKGALAIIDLPTRAATARSGLLRWLLPPDAVPG